MTDDEIAKLMVGPGGNLYGTSYIANNLAAHGCNATIVAYLHGIAESQNRLAHDRGMILMALKDADPEAYNRELKASFARNNPKANQFADTLLTEDASLRKQLEDAREALRKILDLQLTPIAEENAAVNNGKTLIMAHSIARKALKGKS